MASVSGSIVPSRTETLTGEEKEMARPPAESALRIQCHPLFIDPRLLVDLLLGSGTSQDAIHLCSTTNWLATHQTRLHDAYVKAG